MSLLTAIFIEPGKAFEQLMDMPGWLLPALLLAFSTALFAVLYFLGVYRPGSPATRRRRCWPSAPR